MKDISYSHIIFPYFVILDYFFTFILVSFLDFTSHVKERVSSLINVLCCRKPPVGMQRVWAVIHHQVQATCTYEGTHRRAGVFFLWPSVYLTGMPQYTYHCT